MIETDFFVFVLQAFRETIGIFQQKNESFKNALKDVEEVSVSVTSELLNTFLHFQTFYWKQVYLDTERRAGETSPSLDPWQWSDHVHEVQRAFQRSDTEEAPLQGLWLREWSYSHRVMKSASTVTYLDPDVILFLNPDWFKCCESCFFWKQYCLCPLEKRKHFGAQSSLTLRSLLLTLRLKIVPSGLE